VPLVRTISPPVFGPHTPEHYAPVGQGSAMDLLALVSKPTKQDAHQDPTEAFNKIGEFYQAYANFELPRGGPKTIVGGDYLIRLGLTPGRKFSRLSSMLFMRNNSMVRWKTRIKRRNSLKHLPRCRECVSTSEWTASLK